ncbi:PREDICTED: uncharacterized protein LOC104809589 [Tarenaya hassleriana]|uniref:uncharacterized protein LOC104809589 n=1 Tax=Tarenaya hassleriana TaxID=28532 RepID=UPI00053C7277|nr:PREDICTED: uncharacterized protein LOC104809589 [Tarenaya hassleriana]
MNSANEIITGEVESVEISIQNLLKSWHRRQIWRHFCLFRPKNQQMIITGKKQWRITITNFLESYPVHVFTILLLSLDILFTSLELSSSLLSCKSDKKIENGNEWYRWGGTVILSILAAKSIALSIGMGISFFRRPGCVVDGAGAIGALVLQVFLQTKGAGLIVVVCLWRVLRVVETAFELSDEAIEVQIDGIIAQFRVLSEENRQLLETIAEKDDVIKKLDEELNQYKEMVVVLLQRQSEAT